MVTALLLTGCIAWESGASAAQREILIAAQCEPTGPTQITGTMVCPALQDYVNLINAKGSISGYKIGVNEIDNNYQLPSAIEGYERRKLLAAVSQLIWGTPQAQALNRRLQAYHITGTSSGFGSAAANGGIYPYLFPLAATYQSQAAAAIQYVKDQLSGNVKGKNIAYIDYDNPAGTEPLPILKDLQWLEG